MTEPEPDAVDELLQACLDARRDPLDDAELCERLAADPVRLERFSRLAAALRALPTATPSKPRTRRWPLLVTLAAAGGLAFVALFPPATARAASRILSAQLQETSPRAWLAADVTTHEQLVVTATTRFESYQRWSSRR